MTHAVRVHGSGGPEVMRWEEVDVPEPDAGQVRLRQTAVGLNFIDVYHRSGLYPIAAFPAVLGLEGAGGVEKVGSGVRGLAEGDRVAYASAPMGAYAEARVMPAERVVKLPAGVADDVAAAMMLKGLTAQFLLRRTYRVDAGDPIVIHAAAGGVGLLVCQWARALGATVIGTVGSDAKAEIARAHGCEHPIVTSREDFVARVRDITGGAGAAVVYDSVGKDTFSGSLDCLRPMGMLVMFGQSSGVVPTFDLARLAKGSYFLTRPSLMVYTAKAEDYAAGARELFEVVERGQVKIEIGQRYALRDAAQAHRDLEGRKTTGSTVLTI
ncbi:MAG: quinone oxidoreductase [Deltaproteobacteria bacterium]|nr:quinone oxidoreductase [Deltaproteobacteria bacterium]